MGDFVKDAFPVAAHRMIEEKYLIRLSVEDQRRFVDLLLNPKDAVPALEHAKQAHARLIRFGR